MASESESSFWQKTKHAFSKAKSGEPVGHVSNKAAAQDFWPTGMDEESNRAARMLRTFFVDGFVVPYRTLNSIPNEALKHSKGIAVFTILREGLRPEGSAGSGLVVLRLLNGQWSPPAGVLVHTNGDNWNDAKLGDAYDCLLTINEDSAINAFKSTRCTFGDDVTAPTPGPLGGSLNDTEVKQPRTPVWMWVKSKGHWIEDAQLKGVTLEERNEENARYYGVEGVRMQQILNGEVQAPSGPTSKLLEVLEAVETSTHDSNKLPGPGKSPGDYVFEAPK